MLLAAIFFKKYNIFKLRSKNKGTTKQWKQSYFDLRRRFMVRVCVEFAKNDVGEWVGKS